MQKLLLPGLLALLAVLAAAIWWLMDGGEVGAPNAPGAAVSTTPGAASGVTAAIGDDGMATSVDGTNNRVAVVDAAGSRKDKDDPDAGFVGLVVDEKGSPVADATVTCVPAQGFDPGDFDPSDFEVWDPSKQEARLAALQKLRTEVKTEPDGSFRLVPRGDSRRVDLRVLARGLVVLQQNPQRPRGQDIDLGTLQLLPGATVSGRVLDRTGKAIVGATVDRRDRGEWDGWGGFDPFGGAAMRPGDEVVTDSEGRFELAHVRPGTFSLRSRHPDHPVAQLEGVSVAPGKSLSDLLILTEAGATITGHVTDLPKERVQLRVLANPRAPEGQHQELDGPNMVFRNNGEIYFGGGSGSSERSVEVAADGSFTLRGLHMDRAYTIWAMQSGAGQVGSSPCSQRLDVPSGGHDIKLRYEAGVTVVCHVIDSLHGTPIEQLVVTTRLRGGDQGGPDNWGYWGGPGGNNQKMRDYPNGDVTIANLRPQPKQTLSLTIDAVGYERLQKDKIAMPMLGNLDLGTLRLEPMPVVDVAVTAAIDNQPVEGATVSLRQHRERGQPQNGPPAPGGPRSGKTDANGHCKLNGMPGQQVVVSVASKEHAPFQSEPIALPAEGNYRFAAQLLRGGDIEVQVLDADAKPVVEARVERRDGKGRGDSRTTDASGKALFERLVPGDHRFRIGRRDDPGNLDVPAPRPGPDQADDPSWALASVADGGRTELVLHKQPTAALSGIVRENGLPLAGARISFQKGLEDAPRDRNQPWFDGNGPGNGARTDEQGNYELKELPPGEHRLRVWHRTRTMTATVAVTLRIGTNNRDVDLDVSTLRGVVRSPDGKPVAKASVSVAPVKNGDPGGDPWMGGWNGGSNAQTKADGHYELRGVAADTELMVTASADGFAAASVGPIEVGVRSSRDDVDVQLLAAGSIHVTVAPEFGRVWASAHCVDGPGKGQRANWEQVETKGAVLANLQAGRWSVRLTGGTGEDQERTVEVVAGQVTEVRF